MAPEYKSIDDVLREQRQPQYMRLTVDRVRTINRWRMQYMLLYFGWFFLQTLVYLFAAEGLSRNQILTLGIAATALIVFFYVRFVGVLRAVGYSWLMIVPSCLLALLPIPGILVVVYLDRTIGKTFSKGMARAEEAAKARDAERVPEPRPTRVPSPGGNPKVESQRNTEEPRE